MAKILWDESMATGLAEIDGQHKELLEKLNELSEAIEQRKGRQTAGELLDFLQFYAAWHFEREEACMEKYHCPLANANKQGHQEFLRRFGELHQLYEETGLDTAAAQEVYRRLLDWVVNHILRIDTSLAVCVPDSEKG
jgi:hemerythrin